MRMTGIFFARIRSMSSTVCDGEGGTPGLGST